MYIYICNCISKYRRYVVCIFRWIYGVRYTKCKGPSNRTNVYDHMYGDLGIPILGCIW